MTDLGLPSVAGSRGLGETGLISIVTMSHCLGRIFKTRDVGDGDVLD